eukprot:365249-Chlamydomonas_euryale.AAC.17
MTAWALALLFRAEKPLMLTYCRRPAVYRPATLMAVDCVKVKVKVKAVRRGRIVAAAAVLCVGATSELLGGGPGGRASPQRPGCAPAVRRMKHHW